jgi:uncharacterized protein (DUF2141 family)
LPLLALTALAATALGAPPALATGPAIATVPVAAPAPEQAPTTAGATLTLTVVLDGLASDAGTAAIAVYDTSAAYEALQEPVRKARLQIVDRRCTWTVEALPPGDYAVTAYHDLDGDGELDKGAFGIPSEPYGFSNGARGKLGPPAWKAVRVSLTGDTRLRVPLR